MFDKILICLNGSKRAEQILPYATEQARRFNSKVVLIQVYRVPTMTIAADAEAAPAVGPDLLQQDSIRLESEARSYLDEVAQPFRSEGIDVSCVVLQGMAGDVIVEHAQSEGIDLIALATHAHRGLGRVIFGSVADHVLRQSGLPVLMIRTRDPED